MKPNTETVFVAGLVLCGLIAAVLLSIEMGRSLGRRRRLLDPPGAPRVNRTVEASIFGLMGILIGFTFYGAGTRFDNRRNLTVLEANAIGTAYLRIDLLPVESQPEIREGFRDYVRSRLSVNQKIPDIQAMQAALAHSSALQDNIWRKSVDAAKTVGPAEKALVLASLNTMIDITTDSTVALQTHPPAAVFAMLALTVATSSALAGYMMASSGRDWISSITFAVVLGTAVYVILDYEYPRIGLIRIDPVDQVLAETLERMN
jgi:hypothetical protein